MAGARISAAARRRGTRRDAFDNRAKRAGSPHLRVRALAKHRRRARGMNHSTNPRSELMTAFLSDAGWGGAELRPLPGDASTRHYIRVHRAGQTAMLMDQPQQAEAPTAGPDATPEARRALGYNALARLAGADCGRFVAAAAYLKGCGVGAPEVYAADVAQGFLLLEDLGDDLYTDVLARGG